MVSTEYRACHAVAVAAVILLGTWVLFKEFCNIPASWRADRETAIFRGNLPPIPQYELPDMSTNSQPESDFPSFDRHMSTPTDPA